MQITKPSQSISHFTFSWGQDESGSTEGKLGVALLLVLATNVFAGFLIYLVTGNHPRKNLKREREGTLTCQRRRGHLSDN